MAITWQSAANFNDDLYTILQSIEAPNQNQRFNIHLVNGNPTIGVGFDLLAGGKKYKIVRFRSS